MITIPLDFNLSWTRALHIALVQRALFIVKLVSVFECTSHKSLMSYTRLEYS